MLAEDLASPESTPVTVLSNRHFRGALFVSVVFAVAGTYVGAQESAEPQQSSELPGRISSSTFVTRVEIGATLVTPREPIVDLTADDFLLEVNGERVAVDSVELTRSEERPQFAVVFVDSRHLSPEPRRQALLGLAAHLEQWMGGASPPSVMLVENADQVVLRLPFTDRARTVKLVLEQMAGEEPELSEREMARRTAALEVASALRDFGSQRRSRQGFDTYVNMASLRPVLENYAAVEQASVTSSLVALQQFVSALAGLEGQKTVFFVSQGLAQRPLGMTLSRIQRRIDSRSGNVGDTVEVSAFDSQDIRNVDSSNEIEERTTDMAEFDLTPAFESAAALANAHRVSIFPVRSLGARDEGGSSEGDFEAISDTREGLAFLADRTGGSVIDEARSAESLARELADLQLNRAARYVLAFDVGDSLPRGAHRVDVEVRRSALRKRGVRRGQVQVRHRKGFAYAPLVDRLVERTRAAMSLDLLQNPYGVRLDLQNETPRDDGSIDAELFLSFPLARLNLALDGETYRAAGQVVVLAELGDFGVGPPQQLALDLSIPAGEVEEARRGAFGAPITVQLRPGANRVAVGVWDALAGVGSFVGKTFEVGETAAEP